MTDAKKNAEQLAETWLEAMSILSKKQIESVSFDKTIEATVTDATRASEGIYIVSTGNASFTAYTTEVGYKNNDAVMVTIPQGNYDKQKIIIGKQVNKQDGPIIYKSPFQQFINVSNNLIYGECSTSYYANGPIDSIWGKQWDITVQNFIDSNAYKQYPYTEDNVEKISQYGLIWDSGDIFEQGFTRLGLSAQFSTWLSEYDIISGNYGIVLQITFKCVDPQANNANNTFDKFLIFDSNEFLGDVYNFETYYTQEKLFDIQDFIDYPIVHIILYAYQRNNFKSISSENIYDGQLPINLENNFSTIQPNIFIKDPMVCLGMAIESFQTDTAEILCDGKLTYQKKYTNETEEFEEFEKNRAAANKKILRLRWIHKDEKTGIIAAVEDEVIPEGYEIRWYRHSIGASSPDQFAGAHWERINDATDSIQIEFNPDVNRQEEQIKAIVLENSNNIQRLVAASKPIIFTNDNEVRNKVTLIDANALSIIFEDDEKGHYFLYDESGEIGKNEDTEVRILTAVFDERPDGERELNVQKKPPLNIDECSKVVWTFPNASMNTMIVPMSEASENASVLAPDQEGNYIISSKVQSVGFTIKKQLNNNATQNRIRLDITKDGQDYSAWVDPIFGTAGDNGSDYKVVLTWRNGKNALNLSKDGGRFLEPYGDDDTQTALIGDVVIFDQAGDVVDWPEDATLEANWLVAEFGSSSIKQKEKEEKDIYYPVFRNNSAALNYNLTNNPDVNYQPAGYYYFVENPQDNTGYNYVRFDPGSKTFTNDGINLATDQLYRKRLDNSQQKNRLEFKKVQFATDPLNQETGIINTASDDYGFFHGDVEPIHTINTGTNESPKYEKRYYYSTNKKYFIKVNEQYILDPWLNYQDVETYYEPIEAKEKIYTLNSVGDAVGGLTAAAVNQTVTITASTDVSMDSLFILQLTLKNFGDYDLISYYPIALKDGETRENIGSLEEPQYQMQKVIQYIEGPDRVRYGSSGETDFKKNPYQISVLQFDDNEKKFIQYRHGFNDNDKVDTNSSPPYNYNGYWKLLFPRWDDGKENIFKPILKETAIDSSTHTVKEVIEERYDIPLLNPISVYIPDALPYGIQFIGYDSNNNKVTLWTQPILVYQNKYPSRTLNKWNGKDIETDDGAGTITASGFAAGRKERDDNTFTGVVIGDWSRSKADTAITKNTGVYGFNHGAMSYAFKDDGTGFIGKDGSGRIYFDGNKSLIYSSKWKSFPGAQGMLLDIDDGVIDIRGPFVGEDQTQTQAQIYISPNQGRYLNIKDESGHDLLKISRNNYYLQTSDFDETGLTGVKLDLSSGRFTGYDFLIHAVKSSNNLPDRYIDIDSGNESYPLQIGIGSSPNFKVDWYGTLDAQNAIIEGNITANSGTIGNWVIESTTSSAYKKIIFNSNQNSISLENNNYTTTKDEQVLATFSYAGTLHNSSNTVVLSPEGIIYGANLYSGGINGGTIKGGVLKPLNGQTIGLSGYIKIEKTDNLLDPLDDMPKSTRFFQGSYFGYAVSEDTEADSLNNYNIDTADGISMRTLVTAENGENRVQEVKSTGKNAGMSSTKTITVDGGFTGQVTSYVSVYSTTPSAKMDTVFRTSANDGTSSSSFVRTHMGGVTLLSKYGSTIIGQININRTGDDVIVIQVGNSNIKIGTSNGTTETITINTGGTVNITGRTINLNKPKQVAVDEIPSLSTNFLPGEQTGIYARFA